MAGAVSYGAGAVEVHGLRELQAALRELSAELPRRLNAGLLVAARPVADTAQTFAVERIARIRAGRQIDWSAMRVGHSSGLVYVAPAIHRGSGRPGSKRPNLSTLLIVRAMEPAAEQEQPRVERAVEELLDREIHGVGL